MFTYFHWCIKDTYGTEFVVSDIKEIITNEDISEKNDFSDVLIYHNNKKSLVKRGELYETEKKAASYAVFNIKSTINRLYSIFPQNNRPDNVNIWISKADRYLHILYKKYNILYPEIFI